MPEVLIVILFVVLFFVLIYVGVWLIALICSWDFDTAHMWGSEAIKVVLVCGIIFGIGSMIFDFVRWIATGVWHALSAESFPFLTAGLVGLVLISVSIKFKHGVAGMVGGGLIIAAFSHWVGPITLPK